MSDEQKKPEPPTRDEYLKAKVQLALDAAPAIRPCGECKWPVLNGYCCTYCGSASP